MTCITPLRLALALLLLPALRLSAQQPVGLQFNATGLASVFARQREFLAVGTPRLTAAVLQDGSGASSNAPLTPVITVDEIGRTTTLTYPWSRVRFSYTGGADRLDVVITVSNTSAATISALTLEPFSLRLPERPREYDGTTPIVYHNIGGPTALGLSWNGGALALVNEDIARPLLIGFPNAADPSTRLIFPVRVSTGRSDLSDRLPVINRPVPPGGTDEYRLSLRFAAPAQPVAALGTDVYQRYATAHPAQLRWTDRRPIGSLFLASSGTNYPNNPRGWLNDPSIDTTSPAGIAAFRARVLAYADESIRILRGMNAQGAIVWDLEGEELPQPVTYIGDPRLVGTLAPEMEGVADEFFARLRDAGFRVGLTVRPQQFRAAANGAPARQETSADPAQTLIEKIDYAKRRWGATLIYIDSNGDPSLPFPAQVLLNVAGAHPDVLLIPEHEDVLHYSFTAPYNELRGGVAATPAVVRSTYPTAFSVINTADGPIANREQDLIDAVAGGDVLLFRGWYPDPEQDALRALLRRVPDAAAPEVNFTLGDEPLSGTTVLTATAADNIGVAGVRFEVDGQPVGPEVTTFPYRVSFATAALGNGPHQVVAKARDFSGNSTEARRSITVSNGPGPACGVTADRFTGCYYANLDMTEPARVRLDDAIDFDWGDAAPLEGIPADRFSARWRGVFPFNQGTYEFQLAADDGARVYVDGKLLLDRWTGGASFASARVVLESGTHLVEVEYFEDKYGAVARLRWDRQ